MNSELLALNIRIKSCRMTSNASSSHIGGCLSCADILGVIFSRIIKDKEGVTRFFLSKGHCIAAYLSCLEELGYIKPDVLDNYGVNGSIYMLHCSHYVKPIRFSTGSLGNGFPVAVGAALHRLIRRETEGRDQKQDDMMISLISDGELDEGSTWESIMFAGHRKIDNFLLFVDYNNQQSLGTKVSTLDLGDIKGKFLSFGWYAVDCDGHNHKEISDCVSNAFSKGTGKPKVVICHTIKGYPVSFMKNSVDWHYRSLTRQQLEVAIDEIQEASNA